MGNRRRRCEGVIESSLYQIMTGAILSVLGRCFWLLLLLLQVFFPSSAVLAERTKSNDESNSIRLLGLASHPPTPLSHPEVVPPPGFYRGFWPMNAAAVLLFCAVVVVVVVVDVAPLLLRRVASATATRFHASAVCGLFFPIRGIFNSCSTS